MSGEFINKVIHGHVLDVLRSMPPDFVDSVMTSPPYWALRVYGKETVTRWGGSPDCQHDLIEVNPPRSRGEKDIVDESSKQATVRGSNYDEMAGRICRKCGAWFGQLGMENHPQFFVDHIVEVMAEIRRVLKPTGTLWLNLGDTFCASGGAGGQYGKFMTEKGQFADYKQPRMEMDGGWIQPKQKLMIPERIAIAMQDSGWLLRNHIVWYRRNSMPEPMTDRFSETWESVFLFAKNRRYFFDLDSVRVPHRSTMDEYVPKATPTENNLKSQVPGVGYPLSHLDEVFEAGKNPGDMIDDGSHSFDGSSVLVSTYFDVSDTGWPCYACGKPFSKHFGGDAADGKHAVLSSTGQTNTAKGRLQWQGHIVFLCNLSGKNPGDVVMGYDSKYDTDEGRSVQGYARNITMVGERVRSREDAERLFPGDPVKQQDYINYVHDHSGNPLGPNPGDFFDIPTQSFKDSHFAVYPTRLVERCLKAGSPQWVCKKCGKPREREVVVDRSRVKIPTYNFREPTEREKGDSSHNRPSADDVWQYAKGAIRSTVGLSDCGCSAGFEGGLVLDPFAGSGTTLVVAKQLFRRYIGIDLNSSYVDMARKRLDGTLPDDYRVMEDMF